MIFAKILPMMLEIWFDTSNYDERREKRPLPVKKTKK